MGCILIHNLKILVTVISKNSITKFHTALNSQQFVYGACPAGYAQ